MKTHFLCAAILAAGCAVERGADSDQLSSNAIEAAAQTIPAAFQGVWVADQAWCNSNEPESQDRLRISAGQINGSQVKSLKLHSPTDLEIRAEDEEVLGRSHRLVLSDGGRALTDAYDDRTASPTLTKCPKDA